MSKKTEARHKKMIALMRESQSLGVEALASAFGVSTQTVRRDLARLSDANLLRRRHGGAELPPASNDSYTNRRMHHYEAKVRIATHAAKMIPDGATLFLSIGTTLVIMAEALRAHQDLTIITNNLNAGLVLADHGHRIILAGGELRLPDRDFVGSAAADIFNKHRADFGLYGVAGIDSDGTLLDFNSPEIVAREAIRANARCSILLADHSKFGRRAPAIGGTIHEADLVICDRPPEGDHFALCSRLAAKFQLANSGGADEL